MYGTEENPQQHRGPKERSDAEILKPVQVHLQVQPPKLLILQSMVEVKRKKNSPKVNVH